jgi:hypothetical protein
MGGSAHAPLDGIAIALDGKIMQKLRQPLNRDRPRWQNYAEAPTAAKQKAGYRKIRSAPIAFFSAGFRASRALIQAMLY